MSNQTLYTFKANLKDLVKLQQDLDKATAKLKTLKKTDKEYKAQQAKVKGLSESYNNQAKAMAGATTQANKMNKAGGKLVNTFKSAAVAIAAAFAVRAITGSVKAVISSFAEFEAQMAAVKAISGATTEQFQTLERTALKLGASTVFTATEVGKLQEEFARLGFTVEEIDAATVSTLNLAAATGESLSNSAQIAGSTLRAFNLDAEQTQRVTDVMAASFTNSALNLERFKESMKFVAPVARATGFTIEETSSLLMQLADNGLTGSIAGNALKNVFLKLGDANSKLAKKLGGPVQGIPQLAEAMRKLSAEGFSATEAVDLLDKRSAPAFLALIKNIDGLESGVNILNNAEGAINKMAAIRLDTLQGDFTILKSATEGLSIALGEQFDISLRNIIYSLTKFIQSITESQGALKAIQTTVQLVGVALTGLIGRFAALGAVGTVKFIKDGVKSLVLMTKAIRSATTATAALNAVTKANPFVFVASIVATLAGAYFLLGEEASEAEMKQRRLNDALNESIEDILGQNEATKERASSIRQFVNDFPGLLKFLDLERASNAQLLEIKKLMGTADLAELASKQKKNKVEAQLAQERIDNINEELKAKRLAVKEAEKDFGINSSEAIETRQAVYQSEERRKVLRRDVERYKKRNEDIEKEVKAYVKKLNIANNLIIKDGATFRSKLKIQYVEQLNAFRELSDEEKEIELQKNKDRLEFLQDAVDYNQILGKSMEQFGIITKDAQELADATIAKSPFKDAILNTKVSVQDLSIELSELRKFVSNLDSAFVKGSGAVEGFGNAAGFALNKTKDQFKKLSKLMDDLIDNQFESAIKQADNQKEAALKANQEQIDLMESNIANINSISDKNDKDEIARLIKANKSKYNAIKNLTVEQYNDAIDGEKGNKDAMLEILQSMLDEEEAKLTTAFAYQAQIYASHAATIEKIQNERDLSVAGDIAAAGEEEARALERNELNFFKAMKLRRKTREDLADAEIANVDAEYDRQLQNLQDFYGEDYKNNEEYLRQKEELYRQSTTAINKINQDSLDANVKDQLETINKIAQYYNMAMDAFSTFFTNRMELEKQRLNEFYTAKSDDLNTSLERELEAVEGNAEAEEDVREKYALLQEANEEKKQQAIRAIQKKQFELQKAQDIIQATINGALAMTKVSAQTGVATFAFSPIIAALVAAQIAAIASQKFVGAKGGLVPDREKFAKGGMVVGPSHADGGVKFAVGGRVAELEGGEAVINKRSTAMFRGQLSEMNAAGGGVRFADGGIMPGTSNILQSSGASNTSQQFEELANNIVSGINTKEVIVSEASITGSQTSVAVSELTSTIF